MTVQNPLIDWLLKSSEPWTRYRTRVDLLGLGGDDPVVQDERQALLNHPQVKALLADAAEWPGYALQRHNDARHALHKLGVLADFGLHAGDPGIDSILESILAHQSTQGAFQSLVNVPQAFGGSGQECWTWMACDAPILLHALLAMGCSSDERVRRALVHLSDLVEENGWRCAVAPELGRFIGPGRRLDPCPIANVYALKALSYASEMLDSPAAQAGAEMLLHHWESRKTQKHFLFAMGKDFCKLKYPFIWYDILHVLDVLSRFPYLHHDARFKDMLDALTIQESSDGRYIAGSMYQAWKGWSFANKKSGSPWLTLLVMRIQQRVGKSFDL